VLVPLHEAFSGSVSRRKCVPAAAGSVQIFYLCGPRSAIDSGNESVYNLKN
jgi:hypothetical protein